MMYRSTKPACTASLKCLKHRRSNLSFTEFFLLVQSRQKSKRVKQKWAKHSGSKPYMELALQHFDMFYRPVYGNLWPSIRVSLLTSSKYCALVNNHHSDVESIEQSLVTLGATNPMPHIIQSVPEFYESIQDDALEVYTKEARDMSLVLPRQKERTDSPEDRDIDDKNALCQLEPLREKNTNLYDFVPTTEVLTEKEALLQEEIKSSTYRGDSSDVPIKFVKDIPTLPAYLKFYIFEEGNISNFPPPKMKKNSQLGYYMMDAASLLPVIALGLEEKDQVLDMCAAPGGKSLAILQSQLTSEVVCNDSSSSRLKRLQHTMNAYIGENSSLFTTSNSDGLHLTEGGYDKVLVDVPCNTDRHVVSTEENNLFKPGRLNERLSITTKQRNLLVAGIKACAPGGSIVYSTCTLSPAQNDGVIQAVCEYIWKETNIDIAVVETNYIPVLFKDIFRFYNGCRYGQLVLPTLSRNFGPSYLCKIKRLN